MFRWFLEKPYTKAMYISAAATRVMTVIAGIMTWTLVQNSSALKLSADALNLQKSEFRIRNRPRLIYSEPQLRGEAPDQSGKVYPHHIYLKVVNFSDLPAINARTVAEFYVDGNRAFGTVASGNDLHKSRPQGDPTLYAGRGLFRRHQSGARTQDSVQDNILRCDRRRGGSFRDRD